MSSTGLDNPFAPPLARVDDVVIAEGTLVPATRMRRLLATGGDLFGGVAAAMGIEAAIRLPARTGMPGELALIVLRLLAAAALLGLFAWTAVLVHRHGQTLGKRALGIRVVRSDGSRASFGRIVLLRWLPLFLASLVPVVGYAVLVVDGLPIFRKTRQCLHDSLADTVVVTARSSEGATLAHARRFPHA